MTTLIDQKDRFVSMEMTPIKITLNEDVNKELIQAAAQAGVSPAVLCIASMNLLISTYSDTSEIPLRLLLNNNVQLVSSIHKHKSLMTYAQQCQAELLCTYENDKELEHIQVLYTIQDSRIVLEAEELNEKVSLQVWIEKTIFSKDDMLRICGHYENILKQSFRIAMKDIVLISEAEKNQIINDFNFSWPHYDLRPFTKLFEEQVHRTPENIAIIFEDMEVTYDQLNKLSNQLARFFLKKGIDKQNIIPVLIDRSPLFVSTVIALWKIGKAYIPIDSTYPSNRIMTIIGESKSNIVLGNQVLSVGIETFQYIHVSDHMKYIEDEESDNLSIELQKDAIAYTIFTSGSTGKPKGAVIEQLGMMNHIHVMNEYFQIDYTSVIAQTASQCFDISVWQFFSGLLTGAKIIIYKTDVITNIRKFASLLHMDGITILQVVPSYLGVMLNYFNRRTQALPDLQHILVTGENVRVDDVYAWRGLYPNVKITNAYGPAEAADDITLFTLDDRADYKFFPIGKPIRNAFVYIVDEEMNLCPIGVKGEIVVSGICVGRGYLHDHERTAKVFLEKDMYRNEKIRMYKTGDLGYWLPDGNIKFYGRTDHQIKIRGHRIETEEVESCILHFEGISKVVVIYQEHLGQKHLCAYIVTKNGTNLHTDALRAYMTSELPEYMIPSVFVQIPSIPLNPNGKVDRKQLKNPFYFN